MANPEHTKKLDDLFGRPYTPAIPNPNKIFDLSKNSTVPVETGLELIQHPDQEGGTPHFSHIPILCKDLFEEMTENPNTLQTEIDMLMESMTNEERELCEKYLDHPENPDQFALS